MISFLNLHKTGLHPEVVTQGLEAKLTLFTKTLADWRDYSKWHSLYDLIWKIYDDRFYYDYVVESSTS